MDVWDWIILGGIAVLFLGWIVSIGSAIRRFVEAKAEQAEKEARK